MKPRMRWLSLLFELGLSCCSLIWPSAVAMPLEERAQDVAPVSGAFQASDGTVLSYLTTGGLTTLDAPDYAWWYGCSPTAAGMLMGYYDRNGYLGDRYDNLVPGGLAEELTFPPTPAWDALVKRIIASEGHVADFYIGGYMASGDDRVPPPPWHSFDSLADFMGTSQDSIPNRNGETRFYYFGVTGAPLTAQDAEAYGVAHLDGMYGLVEYLMYAGYGYRMAFTQVIDTQPPPLGFSFDQYKEEIDAGRPVLIHVYTAGVGGHTMLGYGYDDTGGATTVYVRDTWSLGPHTMNWGGSYEGMDMLAVTVLELATPEPSTMALLALGLFAVARRRTLRIFR